MYHVIRTVKGNKYLYQQESYRDSNGKVRTKSIYIGPVNKYTGEIKEKSKEEKTPEVLINKIKDIDKYSLNLNTLEENYAHLTSMFERIGVDTQDFPKIILKHNSKSGEVKFKKSLVSPHYTVYLPKNQKGNREKFKKAYRKAIAIAGLDYIKKQNPLIFNAIKEKFDKSYRETQKHLNAYILQTNDYNRQYKAIVLKFFGIYRPTYQNPMNPDNLGLTGHKRKNWVDEYGDLMANIVKEGYSKVSKKSLNQFKRAEGNEEYCSKDYLKQKRETGFVFRLAGWTRKAQKAYKRATARRQAQQEMRKKLNVLNEIFKFEL